MFLLSGLGLNWTVIVNLSWELKLKVRIIKTGSFFRFIIRMFSDHFQTLLLSILIPSMDASTFNIIHLELKLKTLDSIETDGLYNFKIFNTVRF